MSDIFMSEALKHIYKLIDQIKEDEPSAAQGVKSAGRRIRVALSEISKLCKESRVDVLAKMKE